MPKSCVDVECFYIRFLIMTASSTERECDRRQTMMDQLVTRQKQLELTFENKDQRSIQRYILIAGVKCEVLLGVLFTSAIHSGCTLDLI